MSARSNEDARSMLASRIRFIFSAWHDQSARIFNIDILTVAIAIMLPWSTSGVAIGTVLWFAAMVPSIDWRKFLGSLKRPISLLPIALVGLAIAGTLWSDAKWSERLYAVGPTLKLLVVPALLYHYQRSDRGPWVFKGFVASCALLSLVSWLVVLDPGLSLKGTEAERGIFVKNYIDQSHEFSLCIVALAFPIVTLLREGKIWQALLLCALVLSFLLNMVFVIVSRTALVTMPAMLALFVVLHFRRRTNLVCFGVAVVLAGLAWTGSPQLRITASRFASDYSIYKENLNQPTSIGYRLEFWMKSLHFFAEAPVIGHGSGSTRGLFEKAATGPADLAAGQVIANPHNQTLNVAVQWGATGVAILLAMWLSHLLLFRGDGLANWIGLIVVVQNVSTSLFNSHLFDFHEGWMYVLGVGVAGGMVLRQRLASADRGTPLEGAQAAGKGP
jgi:O-antigen ligase